ncbi:pyridoxal-phosphate dependent enzyme [Mesorhizobium sp.]|uniref:threonine synthase n=1 Tax=Mesorhizobium sp. TaxID=1871066 RepID=UPI000FE73EEC|nr:pyridoxal-phosphate dependent enzyme [Mesorhizobium sp.]RWM38703.1 MAG: pyridoxal-phosphate dependent enzyme [Mesorhizobium sp.]
MGAAQLNPHISGMRCIRCGRLHPVADYFEGCPHCLAAGFVASVAPAYERFPTRADPLRPEESLAYPGGPFLGEGRTPLIELSRLAREIGVQRLSAKYEGANPTGSHKDRMSALVVQRAREAGATTVAAASSGNAGVSLAAYAAHAGLKCVVVTTPKMNANWRRAVEMHGAELVATATSEERWQLVARKARSGEWYPATNYLTPPVGSNPFGVDGYRAIAIELHIQMEGDPATDILVPTSRGDVLWGVAKGFHDLRQAGLLTRLPKIHAVEPFPRLTRVVAGADLRDTFRGTSALVSVGGLTVTFQALQALEMTGGSAVTVEEHDVQDDQRRLACAGLFLELSSAAALTGLKRLMAQKVIASDANAVLVATSHGYKEEAYYEQPINTVSVD